MATTNLFTDPVFKDGAFTSHDPAVRAYALQKTMRSMDLGVELGAQIYVFWGGREGAEADAAKDPVQAIVRFRDAINFLCDYAHRQEVRRCASRSRPSPTSRAATSTSRPPPPTWASSRRSRTRRWSASTRRWRTSRWPA